MQARRHLRGESWAEIRDNTRGILHVGERARIGRLVQQVQLQLNLLHKSPDTGALADVQNTAGIVAYLSPGLTAQVSARLHLFVFAQVPVYSNLYGTQLFPRWTVSAGATYGF